jgi:hypothetical protein
MYRSSGTLGKRETETIRKKLLQHRIYGLIYLLDFGQTEVISVFSTITKKRKQANLSSARPKLKIPLN